MRFYCSSLKKYIVYFMSTEFTAYIDQKCKFELLIVLLLLLKDMCILSSLCYYKLQLKPLS